MERINPKEYLKAYVDEYRNEPKGYYYISGYANKLLFLIEKLSNDVNNLYFVKLRLEDFINDDLEDLLRSDSKSRSYKVKLNSAVNNLSDIKSNFFKRIENVKFE